MFARLCVCVFCACFLENAYTCSQYHCIFSWCFYAVAFWDLSLSVSNKLHSVCSAVLECPCSLTAGRALRRRRCSIKGSELGHFSWVALGTPSGFGMSVYIHGWESDPQEAVWHTRLRYNTISPFKVLSQNMHECVRARIVCAYNELSLHLSMRSRVALHDLCPVPFNSGPGKCYLADVPNYL